MNKLNIQIKYNKYFMLLVLLNMFALMWIMPFVLNVNIINATLKTQQTLQKIEILIKEFKQEFNELPKSTIELKIFSHYQNKNISFYDAFGQKIEYIKLNSEYFILRSFGQDQTQNTLLTDEDICINNIKKLPHNTPTYIYKKDASLEFYPAIMLAGAYSPNKQWFAKIFADPQVAKRQLIIINTVNKNFIMTAQHDFVEEYLWLPNSYKIVYSATSSHKYKDGIYLWDILTDQTINLLEKNIISPVYNDPLFGSSVSDADNTHLYVSLNGISEDGTKIYAYITPVEKEYLNPRQFFRYAKLIEININTKSYGTTNISSTIESLAFLENQNFFNKAPKIMTHKFDYINDQDELIYNDWHKLPLEGRVDEVIDQWQEFAQKYADSIIMPYFLWYLSSLYSDAFRLLQYKDPKKANILRSYGTEIAKSLSTDHLAPSYLRSFGRFIYKTLYEGEPLPYSFSKLHL